MNIQWFMVDRNACDYNFQSMRCLSQGHTRECRLWSVYGSVTCYNRMNNERGIARIVHAQQCLRLSRVRGRLYLCHQTLTNFNGEI